MHGIKSNLLSSVTRALAITSTATIGIVVTADDADEATFPLNKAVGITNISKVLSKAGKTGTLLPTLTAISEIVNAKVAVVRVAADPEDEQDALVVGAQTDGVYTGMQALLMAERDAGFRPRILAAPGLDTKVVTTGLIGIAKRLRGFVYAMASGATPATAITYAKTFTDRELMLFWPATSAGNADTIARAIGLRSYIDQTTGWHKTISNVTIPGVTGMAADVSWAMDDDTSDAALLNAANITTLIYYGDYRFWGNRTTYTSATDKVWAFESIVRTSQVLQDTFQTGLFWAMDQPLTLGLIKTMIGTVNGALRKLVVQGRLIGGKCWYDAGNNDVTQLTAGDLAIDYDFTGCAPLEGLTENQTVTDKYYADFAASLTSTTTATAA